MSARTASVRRDTLETKINVDLNLDGTRFRSTLIFVSNVSRRTLAVRALMGFSEDQINDYTRKSARLDAENTLNDSDQNKYLSKRVHSRTDSLFDCLYTTFF